MIDIKLSFLKNHFSYESVAMDQIDPEMANSEEANDASFEPGKSFDQNNGRRQTRLFAEAFHRHVKVPLRPDFSLLDVGCALGDALPVWRRAYPEARLHGCDFSRTAIRRCQEAYGSIAQFLCASFEEISDHYDVIYCSNVLEHFSAYLPITDILLRHCKILYVMVPYMELRNGKRLSPGNDYYHKTTFDLSSFDELASSRDCIVSGSIIRAPGAWSPTAMGEARWFVRRHILRRPGVAPRQALFKIMWRNCAHLVDT